MRRILPLLAGAGYVLASRTSFSVHDDILAFPQYDVVFSDTFVLDTDASAQLAASPSTQSSGASTPSSDLSYVELRPDDGDREAQPPVQSYELVRLKDKAYLCAIPAVSSTPSENSTSAATAAAAREVELQAASVKGWSLLKEMNGKCLFYISGYWSYSFCYGHEVRQFHQLPPGKDVPLYPPVEDQSAPAFILGLVEDDTPGTDVGRPLPAGGEVQIKGETRYLRQKLEGGSECDLTGKGRKVEVQFHCHPSSPDKIAYIKEVATCSYLMIVYTARLCNDKVFLPPKDDRANTIACREVIKEEEVSAWKGRVANEAAKRLGGSDQAEKEQPPPRLVVGGIEIGAMKHVGTEGRRLELTPQKAAIPAPVAAAAAAEEGRIEIVATSAPQAEGGRYQRLTDKELRKRDIKPELIEEMRQQLDELHREGGWRLEIMEIDNGDREIRGVPNLEDSLDAGDADPADPADPATPEAAAAGPPSDDAEADAESDADADADDAESQEHQGSEEELKEEL